MDDLKIIGLMLTWNNLEFFKCAFEQGLEFCDEVIIVDGSHSSQYPKSSTDGTVTFINSIRNRPRVHVMDFNQGGRYDYVQKAIRYTYPMKSQYYKPGNWVFHWDDDNFFFNKDLPEIKYAMKHSKEDSLDFSARRFIFNFRFNCLNRAGTCSYRITDGLRLMGVHNAYYSDFRRYTIRKIDAIIAFHYPCVKKPERQKARWVISVEKGTKNSIGLYDKWMGISWERDEDIFKDEDIIKDLVVGDRLNIYKGEHPEALANHPWRDIDDVRKVT